MSTGQSLSDRIAALAEETPDFDGQARVLAPADLETLLDTIDSTVLPCALTFNTGSAQLTLEIAGRRLHAIKGVEGDLKAPDRLIDQPLSMDDEVLRSATAKLLKTFLDDATSLNVVISQAAADVLDDSESLSVATLREDLDLGANDSALPVFERFQNRTESYMTAAIHMRDGALVQTIGSVAHTVSLKIALTTQLPAFRDARKSVIKSHSEPSLTIFSDAIEAGVSLCVATIGSEMLISACNTHDISAINKVFRRIM
ncbi:MAG: hypothetical protein ABJH45_20300 [Paracoccaceae bacterium]